MGKIIQENNINEEAARSFLNDCYTGMDLLPNVSDRITRQIAASVLNVSMPTIERMIQDRQLQLTKNSLLKYIFDNMLCNRPISWNDEDESSAKTDKSSPKQTNIPEKKTDLLQQKIPSLFSEEDFNQEAIYE